jgi:hypothetical protein
MRYLALHPLGREGERRSSEVDFRPSRPGDLGEPLPGQEQHAEQRAEGIVHLSGRLPYRPHLVIVQHAVARFDRAAQVGDLDPGHGIRVESFDVPRNRPIEQLGERREGVPGGIPAAGLRPPPALQRHAAGDNGLDQFDDVAAPDLADRLFAQRRDQLAPDQRFDRPRGAGAGDVIRNEQFGDAAEGARPVAPRGFLFRPPPGRFLRLRVFAAGERAEGLPRLLARLGER